MPRAQSANRLLHPERLVFLTTFFSMLLHQGSYSSEIPTSSAKPGVAITPFVNTDGFPVCPKAMFSKTVGEIRGTYGLKISSEYIGRLNKIAFNKQGQGFVCVDLYQKVASIYAGNGSTACSSGYKELTPATVKSNGFWCITPGKNHNATIGTKEDMTDLAKNLGALYSLLNGGGSTVKSDQSRSIAREQILMDHRECSPTMSLKPFEEVKKVCDSLVSSLSQDSESYYQRAQTLKAFSSPKDKVCEDLRMAVKLNTDSKVVDNAEYSLKSFSCDSQIGARKDQPDMTKKLCMQDMLARIGKGNVSFEEKAKMFQRCSSL